EVIRNIICGGAGTGKSFLIHTIVHLFRSNNLTCQCLAPTGVAASLLPHGETIHKYFSLSRQSISRRVMPNDIIQQKITSTDCFIFDEMSMISKELFEYVHSVIRYTCGHDSIGFGAKI
ncbi:DNA helicase Pif1-like protein, partial [Aduncisulcus paluster]